MAKIKDFFEKEIEEQHRRNEPYEREPTQKQLDDYHFDRLCRSFGMMGRPLN